MTPHALFRLQLIAVSLHSVAIFSIHLAVAHRFTSLSSCLALVKFALLWLVGSLLQISYLSFFLLIAGMILSASSLNQLLRGQFSVGIVCLPA